MTQEGQRDEGARAIERMGKAAMGTEPETLDEQRHCAGREVHAARAEMDPDCAGDRTSFCLVIYPWPTKIRLRNAMLLPTASMRTQWVFVTYPFSLFT